MASIFLTCELCSANFTYFFGSVLLLLATMHFPPARASHYDITDFGAKLNGHTDSTKALLKAWSSVCGSSKHATIYIPKGQFLVGHVKFQGPCKTRKIVVRMDGTLVAPSGYGDAGEEWIVFKHVDGVSIKGGTIDGRGASLWKCKKESNQNCPHGWRSLLFDKSKNIEISGLKSINSEHFHIVIHSCQRAMLRGVKIIAPDESPNTDGISVQRSSDVTILDADIKTGDDCISISAGTHNLWAERISCGPGHGISIGSIGKKYQEKGVENITVKNTVFTESDNGLRIKTWGRPSSAFVRGVVFQQSIMKNVKNPILIDQNYCPHNKNCPNQHSGTKINGVTYSNIRGSSASSVAVKFDCSPSNPCRNISLKNIKLTYRGGHARSSCKHAHGKTSGFVIPHSCISK